MCSCLELATRKRLITGLKSHLSAPSLNGTRKGLYPLGMLTHIPLLSQKGAKTESGDNDVPHFYVVAKWLHHSLRKWKYVGSNPSVVFILCVSAFVLGPAFSPLLLKLYHCTKNNARFLGQDREPDSIV